MYLLKSAPATRCERPGTNLRVSILRVSVSTCDKDHEALVYHMVLLLGLLYNENIKMYIMGSNFGMVVPTPLQPSGIEFVAGHSGE